MNISTSTRRERAEAEKHKALNEGMLNTGKEHALFKSLGVGEPRATSHLQSSHKAKSGKLREQWWAPADLVRFNSYMLRRGVSSKLRGKALRCMIDGKDLPDRLSDVVASYTEDLLLRG
jgi:hypothetical protein